MPLSILLQIQQWGLISWEDVTTIEIKKIFTLCLLMGVVQKPQLHLYWSQDPLFKASIFNVVMPEKPIPSYYIFSPFC